MPDSNLADLSTLTSTFYNTYLREQVVVTCTSGTRPTGVEGRLIYETDTDLLRVYDGATWQRVANDSGNQTVVGVTTATSDSNGDITITYGVTFAASPTVILTPFLNVTQQVSCHLPAAPGVSTCSARTTTNDAVRASLSCVVHWIAVGRVA